MAVIEKRGDGQWRARVRKRGVPEQSKTFTRRTDADTWSKGIEVQIERGEFVTPSKGRTTTFKELAERYLEEVTPEKRSAASERSRIAVLIAEFGPYFVSSITREMVGAFRTKRLQTPALLADRLRKPVPKNISSRVKPGRVVDKPRMLSAQSVIHELNTLSAIIEHARREWGVTLAENPAHVSKPKRADSRTRRVSELELHWLCKAADDSTALGLRQVIVLAVETSMRLGEVLGLQWSRIDLEQRTAHLVDTKNGESRTVALSSTAVTAFRTVREASTVHRIDGRVFHWAAADSFQKVWKRCVARGQAMYAVDCESARRESVKGFLGDLRFHDLRHEAISRLFELGLNHYEVASMSGHKSMQMLKRYTHPEASRVAAKLN